MQKQFYSLCISIKLNGFGTRVAQTIPVAQLYAKAKAKKVPQEQWPEFIRNELTNPANKQLVRSRIKRQVLDLCS